MISSEFFFLIILCLWIYFLWKRRRFLMLFSDIGGPWGLHFFRNAYKLRNQRTILKNLYKYEEEYGTYFYTLLGLIPILFIAEPQIAKDILNSPDCLNKAVMYKSIQYIAEDMIFVLNQPKWGQHRKFITPIFKRSSLMNFFPFFNRESDKLVEIFVKHCGRGEVRLNRNFESFTFALSSNTMMGFELSQKDETIFSLIDSLRYCMQSATNMIFSPWLKIPVFRTIFRRHWKSEKSRRQLRDFISSLVEKRISENGKAEQPNETQANQPYGNFLDMTINLFKTGIFSYKTAIDESGTSFFASTETSSNTIGNVLMLLAMFPEYQQKLFEEIINIFPDRENLFIKPEDLQECVYLDMVVNEVLRVIPAVPLIARKVSNDMELSNGIILPKGLQIVIDIFNMHRRTDIWGPNAHIFNPDNFLPTNLEDKHSYAYIPFAKGARNCIGWRYALHSLKVVTIKLIRNYEFRTSFKFEDLQFVAEITMKLKKTPLLEVNRRKF